MTTVNQWTGRESRALREALRMTIRAFAEHLGVSVRTISKWEAGGTDRQPRPELQAALDTVLERTTDDERSRFELALQPPQKRDPQFPVREQQPVDLVSVASLGERLRRLVEAYDQTPSVSLLTPAAHLHAAISQLRSNAPAGTVRRSLHAVAAETAVFMGQLVWDASQRRDHLTALQYFAEGISLAREVQDPVIEAHATLRQSYVALYGQPDPEQGLALASRAHELARPITPSLAGLALLHVAEAQAMLGSARECEQALHGAALAFDLQTDLDPTAEWQVASQSGRLAGSCYLSLGLHQRAADVLEETVQTMQETRKVNALILGNLSLAYLRSGELDRAINSLHTAITTLTSTRGGGGLNVVFSAGRELRPWRTEPAVQELHDRLLGLVATA